MTAKLLSIFNDKKETTDHSNIKLSDSPLKDNISDFTIVKGNRAYEAYKTTPNLRSIAALYPELLTFVVKKDSTITSLSDKDIKIGYVGQDTKYLLDYIYKKLDLNASNLIEIDQNQTTQMLKNNSIDGYIGLFVHPSTILKDQSSKIDIRFINFRQKVYNQLIRSNSFLLKAKIKKDSYHIQNHDVITLGVKTLLLTSKDCDDEIVYKLTKSLLDNMDKLKNLNPIYKNISKKDLLEELVIPQHNGAIKAFNNMKEDDNL
jgi:TRAP transporter TAXI family solute receptor